jgi:GTPase SAR1 family protein
MMEVEFLQLRGNNGLVTPPREIVQHGLQAMREYMRALAAGEPVRRTIVRVMFVGYAEAGKTKLNYALQRRMAEWKLGSTVGIDTAKWAVDWAGPDSKDMEFRSWDFAGQKDYYAMHHIFLTDRAVYLFLVDISTPQPGEGDFEQILKKTVRFWLDSLTRRTNRAFVRIVATKVDRLEAEVVTERLHVLLDLLREEQRLQSAWLAEKRQGAATVEPGEGLLLPSSIDEILLSSLPQDPVEDDADNEELGRSEPDEVPEALRFSGAWGPLESGGATGGTGRRTKPARLLPDQASADTSDEMELAVEGALRSPEEYLRRIQNELLRLAKEECFQIELPASYVQLMAAVEKRKFGVEAVPYMDWNAFRDEMLVPAGLETEESAEVATTLLHELGIVLWFKPNQGSGDAHAPAGLAQRVFLDPQWVIDLLKQILNHREDKQFVPPSDNPTEWGPYWAREYASNKEGADQHRLKLIK